MPKKEIRRVVSRLKPRRARWSVTVNPGGMAVIQNTDRPSINILVTSADNEEAMDLAFTIAVALNKRLGA